MEAFFFRVAGIPPQQRRDGIFFNQCADGIGPVRILLEVD
jgi:hypothetical protein